eukprot:420012-Rhodomonas_salina.1
MERDGPPPAPPDPELRDILHQGILPLPSGPPALWAGSLSSPGSQDGNGTGGCPPCDFREDGALDTSDPTSTGSRRLSPKSAEFTPSGHVLSPAAQHAGAERLGSTDV